MENAMWKKTTEERYNAELDHMIPTAMTDGNPWPHGEIVHDTVRVHKLAELYATRLRLNADRILAYSLVHAGLSASWDLDDGFDPGYRLKCIGVLTPLVGR
jgi:hypothetical protein